MARSPFTGPVTVGSGAQTILGSLVIGPPTDGSYGLLVNGSGSSVLNRSQLYEPLYQVQANRGISTLNSGSFTGTTTGLVSNFTTTMKWSRSGGVVVLWCSADVHITGTSNANTFTITGAPSEISTATPQGNYSAMFSGAQDNGVSGCFNLEMSATTLKIFFVSAFGNSTQGWTASGTKSLPQYQWGITYSIDL